MRKTIDVRRQEELLFKKKGVFQQPHCPSFCEEWCTEFAAWLISNGTDLNPPRDLIRGNWDLARYFYGLWKGTDLFESRRFITPSNWINNINDNKATPDIINDKRNNKKQNPWGCSWKELPQKVRPGFYAKIKRGGDVRLKKFNKSSLKFEDKTEEEGHSTFFVEWNNAFRKNRKWNEFRAIGGNQDSMVKIKVYNIDKEDNVREKTDKYFGYENNLFAYEVLNDIFWKASRDATGFYGYPDGFGITDIPPVTDPGTLHEKEK